MGHHLQAVIGKGSRFLDQLQHTPQARCAPLPQDYWAVPLTESLYDAVADAPRSPAQEEIPQGFIYLGGVFSWVTSLSETGPVAYLETEFFGGLGVQAAVVVEPGALPRFWTLPEGKELVCAAGSMVLKDDTDSDWHGWSSLPAYRTPVSRALAAIGVAAQGHHDEFDALGLVAYRDNEALVEAALRTLR